MAVYHVSLYFATRDHGWREQFYRAEGSFALALAQGLSLAAQRYSILGAGVSLYRVRVTQPGVPHAYASADVRGTTIPVLAMSALVGAQLRLHGGTEGIHQRTYFLRGLPKDALVLGSGPVRFAGTYAGAIAAWLGLLSRSWLMQVTLNAGPECPVVGITQMAEVDRDIYGEPLDVSDPPEGATYVFAQLQWSPPEMADTVHIRGARVSPNVRVYRHAVNGRFKVASLLESGVCWYGTLEGGLYQGGGLAQASYTGYVPITKVQLRGYGSRHCGPPAEALSPVGLFAAQAAGPRPPQGLSPVTPGEMPNPPAPVVSTVRTARDLAQLIFAGYGPGDPPAGLGLGVAQVVNAESDTYLVVMTGVDSSSSQTPQNWANALASGIGLPDSYTDQAIEFIRENTPNGCSLILAGHSLGGITAEWVRSKVRSLGGRQVLQITSFGAAAITIFRHPPTRIRRFAVQGDPVPYLSPIGFWAWPNIISALIEGPATNSWLGLVIPGGPYFHVLITAEDTPFTPIARHNCYPNLEVLEQYNPYGFLLATPGFEPLELGVMTRRAWVHT